MPGKVIGGDIDIFLVEKPITARIEAATNRDKTKKT